MRLGEKLFTLRKEKGLSQEALAQQLGTTRQAVSKWENDQGYPETEKLMQLSNIFGVSVDYLLKEGREDQREQRTGYYVSKEMARGFLTHEKRVNKYLGLGFMFWALAGIPYVMLEGSVRLLGMAVFLIVGIICMITGSFVEQEEYAVLKQEPLLFDQEVHRELTKEYQSKKKKYQFVAAPCILLFIMGILCFVITVRGYIAWTEYHSLVFLGFAIGFFGFIQSVGTMEAYELLVKNEQYCNKLFFKLKRKVKHKLDKI